MRHMIKTVCCLVLMAAVQGTALADEMQVPGPPPTGGSCQVKLDDCDQSLKSCDQDKKDLWDYAQARCPALRDTSLEQALEEARKPPPVKPRKPGNGGRKPTKPKSPKPQLTIGMERFSSHADCPAGGLLLTTRTGDKVHDTKVVCDGRDGRDGRDGVDGQDGLNGRDGVDGLNGRDGKDGERGRDGYSRIQLTAGTRVATIFTAGRPDGWSVAPELGMKYWLSQTVEFDLGAAWAPGDDRNMVITGQVCRRGIGSRFGLCAGGQYIGWNLEGNLALWHSALAIVSAKVVPIETRHIDVSFEAGAGAGFDGYDADMKFAWGLTGQGTVTLKF